MHKRYSNFQVLILIINCFRNLIYLILNVPICGYITLITVKSKTYKCCKIATMISFLFSGVTCYYVDDNIGVTEEVIRQGFKQFADGIKKTS